MTKAPRNGKAKAAKVATTSPADDASRADRPADNLSQAGTVAAIAGGVDGDGAGGAGTVAEVISTDTPRGSSGTAREASSTGGGTTVATPSVGTQSGSPNTFENASQAVTEGGGTGAFEAGPARAAVKVTAKRDGFRRAGMAHSAAGIIHVGGSLTDEQFAALVTEPELIVEVLAGEP